MNSVAKHFVQSVALAPCIAVTVGGMNVRDIKNGELLWRSQVRSSWLQPQRSNGVFWPSAASGMIYCWEPDTPKSRRY